MGGILDPQIKPDSCNIFLFESFIILDLDSGIFKAAVTAIAVQIVWPWHTNVTTYTRARAK